MKYDMTKPCDACPFRSDKHFPLHYDRVVEITDGLMYENTTFSCHKTTTSIGETNLSKNAQHCGGALIFMEKNDNAHQMMRIAERLGYYDRTKLEMDSPVFEDADVMAEMCSEANGGS